MNEGASGGQVTTDDGAMGFWAALEEVLPATRQQRCWIHNTGNVLNYLPKRAQPKAKKMLHDIWKAETREELLTFYDFLAQHWQSTRTSNPIESAFATNRHRTMPTKGCLSRDSMLHMMFKLGQCAEKGWRELRGFAHLADVTQGVDFINGTKQSNQDQAAG